MRIPVVRCLLPANQGSAPAASSGMIERRNPVAWMGCELRRGTVGLRGTLRIVAEVTGCSRVSQRRDSRAGPYDTRRQRCHSTGCRQRLSVGEADGAAFAKLGQNSYGSELNAESSCGQSKEEEEGRAVEVEGARY
ncbi:hypothetical protein HPP92_027865 [Vanilla planifolia]|uniref:Uncharacterized protein n=1 Tax=Vanilla planifolia TaxID=51239 RepID=A0A835P7C6_VANPL|nr:hypothetical protein HPP92_027865 [Vanilla planifolia]